MPFHIVRDIIQYLIIADDRKNEKILNLLYEIILKNKWFKWKTKHFHKYRFTKGREHHNLVRGN